MNTFLLVVNLSDKIFLNVGNIPDRLKYKNVTYYKLSLHICREFVRVKIND